MQNILLACAFAGLTVPALTSSSTIDNCGTPVLAVDHHGEKQDRKPDIIQTALDNGNFKTLAAALTAADLVAPLQGEGPFTVFAPTDAAFAALPEGTVESLLRPENKDTLTTILTYHVVSGKVAAADVVKLDSATSLNGQPIAIEKDQGGVRVAGAQVTMTDIQCGNGIIHVIDAVMMPATDDIVETAMAAGNFTTLAAALDAAGLVETLKGEGPFTVFAPTDEAFAALPKGTLETLLAEENRGLLTSILTYHVASGRVPAADVVKRSGVMTLNGQRVSVDASRDGVMIDGAKVTITDIQATNGTIHVLDAVVLPSSMNVVETAVEAGTFRTLAAALDAAGLIEVLSGEGPFTVFAPTDEAFAKLPEGTVESLLLPENKDKLIAILKYHVVSGRVYADQLESGRVQTLGKSPVTVAVKKDRAMIDEATVVKADIDATNGVVHVIDTVLLP